MKTERQQAQQLYQTFLRDHPVFKLDDLAAVAGGKEPGKTARERVKYYVGTGRLRRLARQLYAVVPQGSKPDAFAPDALLVAAALRGDAVFSHHTALELLGAGHSDWNVCTAFTAERATTVRWASQTVKMLSAPVRALGDAWRTLGVRDVAYNGRTLRVTGPERTLVEGFGQPRWIGGLPELVESAGGFASLDLAVLRQVLAAYDQRSLWAAVGWFLERYARSFYVTDELLEEFAKHRPRSKQYLLRSVRGGVYASRWNLILPPELVRGGEGDESLG
jgi:predicted transcriptional regulator of viral defense system